MNHASCSFRVKIGALVYGALLSLLLLVAACANAQVEQANTSAGALLVEEVVGGLVHPWGMAFLPDGKLLITERPGRLRILSKDRKLSPPIAGVPEVFDVGQGGLLDVALDPNFDQNQIVYLSFAEPGEGGASTALGRGKLRGQRLEGFQVIFRQLPKVEGPNHFGGRIVLAADGSLFLTTGERFKFEPAQSLANHLGTIVRITPNGEAPLGNPFLGSEQAKDEIWSYGHRNIEAAAIDPSTGSLWIAEMGPKGGDELNLIKKGANYGWPIVSWGTHYDGEEIPDPPTQPQFTDAVRHWTPVISPSGMIFYTGAMFPKWHGSAFLGGLSSKAVIRLTIKGDKVVEEERISMNVRIRDVEQAPDGSIYLLIDRNNGQVLRLASPTAATQRSSEPPL